MDSVMKIRVAKRNAFTLSYCDFLSHSIAVEQDVHDEAFPVSRTGSSQAHSARVKIDEWDIMMKH